MTLVLRNLPTEVSTKNAAISVLDVADFEVQRGPILSANNLVSTTWYAYTSGEPEDETSAVVRHEYNPSTNQTRVSIRFITAGYDTDLDDSYVGAFEGLVAVNYPGKYPPVLADTTRLVQVALGLLYPSFDGTTGIPETTTLSALAFGITAKIAG